MDLDKDPSVIDMIGPEDPTPPGFVKRQVRILLAGAAVVVPFVASIGVLWWLGVYIDDLINDLVDWAFQPWMSPEQEAAYNDGKHVVPLFPGLGFIMALLGIYMVGLLTKVYLFQKLVRMGEWTVRRIPLAKSLYEAVRDLLRFFGGGDSEKMGRVVLVTLADGQVRMLGILTNEQPRGIRDSDPDDKQPAQAEGAEKRVAVYLPMSYQLGGFTVYIEPHRVEPIDMSVEEAMKIAATADVG